MSNFTKPVCVHRTGRSAFSGVLCDFSLIPIKDTIRKNVNESKRVLCANRGIV